MADWQILTGDCLEILRTLPGGSVQCCVTSPPYWGLRDYGVPGQLGLESTPEEYVSKMVEVFREVRRVLRDDGTLWLNLGDCYASGGMGYGGKHVVSPGEGNSGWKSAPPGLKHKDLVGIPWRVAFALQADGWYLRSDIIWSKPNPMPESVTDRPTKAHEYIFLLTKSSRYFYDHESIKEQAVDGDPNQPRGSVATLSEGKNKLNGGRRKQDEVGDRRYTGFNERYQPLTMRNKRTVWTVATINYPRAHFATFPPKLIEPCIQAGSRPGDLVMDPFSGAGTTGLVALRHSRQYMGIELNPKYVGMSIRRIQEDMPLFNRLVGD